MTLIPIYLVGL